MTNVHELKSMLINGDFDEIFTNDFCCDVQDAVIRACAVVDGFCNHFPNDSCSLFSSPGRTELSGNHTDHQRGNILAASVNADMLCAATVTDDNRICVVSEGFGEVCVDLNVKHPVNEERGTAASLIRGMAMWFEERDVIITGVNAYVVSDVPTGAGISSSAAFEVLIGTVFNSFFADNRFSAIDIAKAGMFAENVYFGKPCGLMDQTACAFGGIVSVDFANPNDPCVAPLQYDFYKQGYSLCLVSTGGTHDDLTADYASITEEMRAVASVFGKEYLSEIKQSDVLNNALIIREKCGDRAFLRAINFYEEDIRAKEMASALKVNDLSKYLDLVNQSGRCSFMYLQNIYPSGSIEKQEVAVALQIAELSLKGRGAFRVHGGGFAGTVQAYVPNDMLEDFINDMEKVIYLKCCRVLKIRNVGAAELRVER